MDTMKQICLLLICHGFYLGSVCQQWTYPERITALIGSCVEIPCTYYPARISGVSSIVWYLSIDGPDPEILNTKDSSSIRINYKGRTSLVPGDKSCSLRIDPVRGEDNRNFYYPWIAEDGTMNELYRQASFVLLSVRDKPNIRLDLSNPLIEGEATIVRCSVEHTCRSNSPSLQWDKPGQVHNQSVKISEGFWREESNLTFIPSYEENWTLVRCTATYPDGRSFHESRTLTILDKPTNVTITVLGMGEVMEGSDVTLQCNSFSKRRQVKKYEWYKGKDKTKLPEIGREITVRKVTWDMEPYSCAAINDADGRGESALTEIPVLYAAIGVHMTVKNEGEFTELICDFLSSRPDVTHYTWMKYGSILQSETEKTLSVGNNVENYGKYSCIAHNRAGDSSSKEFLHMVSHVESISTPSKRKKKSSSINGTSTQISNENYMAKYDNHHGNIQSSHNGLPPPVRSEPSVDVSFAGNQAIYSNNHVTQPSTEVEYSVISHREQSQAGQNSSRARRVDDVEYATLK